MAAFAWRDFNQDPESSFAFAWRNLPTLLNTWTNLAQPVQNEAKAIESRLFDQKCPNGLTTQTSRTIRVHHQAMFTTLKSMFLPRPILTNKRPLGESDEAAQTHVYRWWKGGKRGDAGMSLSNDLASCR
jgi:hypothetical protein